MAKFRVAKTDATASTRYNKGKDDTNVVTALKGGLTSQTGSNLILVQAKIGALAAGNASIVKQKGSKKFQVASNTAINDEDMIVDTAAPRAYMIATLGNTNWQACGAGQNAAVGEIFTCKAIGSGSGTAYPVANCELVNLATPTSANTMSIVCTPASGPAFRAKRITNKYVVDFSDNKYLIGKSGEALDRTQTSSDPTPDTVAVPTA